jgi:hypothetical protein
MTVLGTVDAPLDIFGGLVTDMAAADLPAGVSPDCADVAFLPGAVQTRPGLASVFTAIGGNPTVNYLKTYTQPDFTRTLLALDSAGKLWKEASPGSLSEVASNISAGARAKSATLFGREYIAFHDGKFGVDIPRQYDGANFDRVSQIGPAAGPLTVADAAAETAKTVAASPTGAVRASGIVTITTTTAHAMLAGQTVTIAGATNSSFNGVFVIASVPSITTLTFLQAGADATSGAGTATLTPQISAGVHKVAVFFKTRQGYLTQPSPPVSWTAQGGRRVTITGIPIGLSNVNIVARILAFSASGGESFYYTSGLNNTPNMVIANNTTTNLTLDFSDTALLAGSPVDPQFRLVELGECAGVIGYASRLFWWGERAQLHNFSNLSFDGGWALSGPDTPLGWTRDATLGAGLLRGFSSLWGGSYEVLGDGATATRGLITQSAVVDSAGLPRLSAHVRYSVRARMKAIAPLAQGAMHVHLFSSSAGINTTGLVVTAAQVNALPAGAFGEFTAVLTDPLTTIPVDLLLRVFADGTPTADGGFVVDNIEIFPTAQPYNASLVRASRVEDPESYDGVSGLLSVAENDGQAVRSAFVLRGQLYFVKEHSIHATQDDGVNEPAAWTLTEVSRSVGTPSVDGVDTGEDWAAIAHRSGLYLFAGGEPVKVSQEIQPLWDQINWAAGHKLWVRVDTRSKRILVGVPIGAATEPNRILVLDYRGLHTAEEIASMASISSGATTRALAGRSRKWAPWHITAATAALVERTDGAARLFLGNGAANGKIYELSAAQFSDDGVAIASYYTTSFLPGSDDEPTLQTGAHRKLFCHLACHAEGAGNLALTAFPGSLSSGASLPALALASPAARDLELPINVLGERVAFQVGTNSAGSWFRLSRLVPSLRPDPWSYVRGGN